MTAHEARERPVYLNGRFLRQALSGVQRFAAEISAGLVRQGMISEIVVPPSGKDGGDLEVARSGQVPIRPFGYGSGHLWEQTMLPWATSDGLLVNLGNTAPLLARRQIVVIHDCGWASVPEAYSTRFRATYRVMQTGLIARRTRIVTVSEFARGEIIRHLGARPEQVSVIPEGGEHVRAVVADPTVLAENDLVPGRYVLVVGNLVAHKNLRVLAKLGEALEARGMVLAIAGARRDGIFQQQGGADMPRAARYLGRVSDGALRALYEHAACFVFPSRYEGFGLPAVEAMACACPVVASDIPVLREVCGEAALFADPFSQNAFVHQVMRLLDEDGLADRLREAGAARLLRYNWAEASTAMANVIQAALHAVPTHVRRPPSMEPST
ncbi:glycosyltransferase family 4 protein [Gluconacetobacter sp. 1b LMG 1731]|uniref:Glycosyltransferase family 4 protein n=1 Tax=Gluconacetobacter dulcium TaxID=2729096 RepID=A0A7W4NS31_9PROT|nr:glycosyltransferase family 1 protein [Gluconacetobacter dulcium]MBB2164097.1 glycosyltransferase family 4 protein [Gluconacetobacter dulcium]MBB2192801.1 glycosyltransferase family 4 protein [Gluconacetobacter dulcium]